VNWGFCMQLRVSGRSEKDRAILIGLSVLAERRRVRREGGSTPHSRKEEGWEGFLTTRCRRPRRGIIFEG